MRSAMIFVVLVVAGAVLVFLVSVTQFTPDPFVWTVRHPGYAAAALVPVIPVAVLARLHLRRREVPAGDDTSDDAVGDDAVGDAAVGDAAADYDLVEDDAVDDATGSGESVSGAIRIPLTEPESGPPRQFSSVEQLAVASVLERGRTVADVARTLKIRPATVEMWLARAGGPRTETRPDSPTGP